ncbi:MAG: hypothetical protein PHP28_13530 [Actinomycetota bacterium]|nr:hypothetical protein [Actinomycetota bacterium]MDD5667865.1 hypothetical protein [Actinomycetota bacterium]
MKERKKRSRAMAMAAGLALMLAATACGCAAGDAVEKVNLTGQLEKINQEVAALNAETTELVETISVLDEKEGQLSTSVELLLMMNGKTDQQLATTSELSAILGQERAKVAAVLSLARQVLAVEQGLKGDTAVELGMAGSTLDLVRSLLGNLGSFASINNDINSKLDRALEIMGNM